MAEKPILFNTEMVKEILEGQKTQTRRVVKEILLHSPYCDEVDGKLMACDENGDWFPAKDFSRIQPGDVLWVRETWQYLFDHRGGYYVYKADFKGDEPPRIDGEYIAWRPSIHMPKKAARLFLRVTDVRVERLHDIDADGIKAEGLTSAAVHCGDMEIAMKEWALLWNSTIKKTDLPCYGWCANPWVWVIEFERKE